MTAATLFSAQSTARLRDRAAAAAAAGQATFAIPEAAPAASLVAETAAGPLRAEAQGWLAAGARYHDLVRLAARAVLAASAPEADAVYVPKAQGELEPLLAVWPSVLAIPTTATLGPLALVRLRAYPVHPLGVVRETTWGDGRPCSPAEYFFHDVDHARFKVREDLLALGVAIPDAYRDGDTLDPATGRHRVIVPAVGRIGDVLWERAAARAALAERLCAGAAALEGPRAAAAELLLFELVHEKSFPLEAEVLARELDHPGHVEKVLRKAGAGFYGAHAPAADTLAALGDARQALRRLL